MMWSSGEDLDCNLLVRGSSMVWMIMVVKITFNDNSIVDYKLYLAQVVHYCSLF